MGSRAGLGPLEPTIGMMKKYLGETNVGDRFLWEVSPQVLAHVAIVEIKDDGAGPALICTVSDNGVTRWVDESRFRSSCFWIGKVVPGGT